MPRIGSRAASGRGQADTTDIPDQTRAPFRIESNSTLMEDFSARQDLLLSPERSTLAMYPSPSRPGQLEGAAAIDGQYATLKRDPGGWKIHPWSDPKNPLSGVTDVTAAVLPDGRRFGFAATPEWLAYLEITADGPKYNNAESVGGVRHLRVAYTPPLPQRVPVLYGATADGNLVLTHWAPSESPPFETYRIDVGGSLRDGNFTLFALDWSSVILFTSVGGILTWYTISSHGLGGPYRNGDRKISAILTAYQEDHDKIEVVVLGTDQRVYLARGLENGGHFEPVGNLSAVAGRAVVDAQSLMHIYLIDAQHNLSVLHQTGWSPFRAPLFTEGRDKKGVTTPVAIPLAAGVSAVRSDGYPGDHNVLAAFSSSVDGSGTAAVRLLGQDPVSESWWSEPVQLAAPHFYKSSRWHTRATLRDSRGDAVPFHYVSLHAETTCAVDVHGETHVLGPDRPGGVEVRTDPRGQINFTTAATGLTAPPITIAADGLPVSAEIRADAPIQAYLTGNGTLPFLAPFSGDTLKNATINGHPLVPKQAWDHHDAVQVVQAMRDMVALADPNLPRPSGAGFLVQSIDTSRPAYRSFATTEEMEEALEALRQHASYGGFFDDLKEYASDVWEGIKTGATKVAAAAADVASGAVKLFIRFGEKVLEVADAVIETLADAFDAVTAIFSTVLTGAADVLHWLERVFSWNDVWNSKKAIESAMQEFFPIVAGLVERARNNVDSQFFAKLNGWIDQAFAALGPQFDNVTLGEITVENGQPSFLVRAGQAILHLQEILQGIVDPVVMWLWDKLIGQWLEPLSELLPSVILPKLAPALEPARRLVAALEAVLGDLTAVADNFYAWLTAILTRKGVDPAQSFKDTALTGLLAVCKKASLASVHIVQTLVDALLDALQAVAGVIGGVFSAEIKLPAIGDIWSWIQEHIGLTADQSSLTVGGFFSLLVAAPTTFIFKLIYGEDKQPFPGGKIRSAAATTPQEAGRACILVGTVAATLNNALQFVGDLYAITRLEGAKGLPRDIEKGLSIATIVLQSLTIVFTWPSKHMYPGEQIEASTDGDQATLANWLISIANVLVDIALFAAAGVALQFSDPIGLLVDSVFGLASLVAGIVESRLAGETSQQLWSNILQPLPSIALPLRSRLWLETFPENPAIAAVALAVKVLTDIPGVVGTALKSVWTPADDALPAT